MKQKSNGEIKTAVIEALEEVVMPAFEHVHESIEDLRQDVRSLKKDVKELQDNDERIERKLDNVILVHGDKLSGHEKRITKLEQHAA
ncbi:hypothetical protein HY388_02620 [Candidatus Daviesbacteria bacterium]|nr:hypothetical protein [Candidatus Daviesbacteria bacterium]